MQTLTQKNCVGINFVSPQQGHLGQMCQHLAVAVTCCQHVGNFRGQGGEFAFNLGVDNWDQTHGKLPALVGWYYRLVFFYCKIWRDLFYEEFPGLFLNPREVIFSSKGGLSASKRGPKPLFWREKGAPAKFLVPKINQPSFLLLLVGKILVKYQPIPTENTNLVNNSS